MTKYLELLTQTVVFPILWNAFVEEKMLIQLSEPAFSFQFPSPLIVVSHL